MSERWNIEKQNLRLRGYEFEEEGDNALQVVLDGDLRLRIAVSQNYPFSPFEVHVSQEDGDFADVRSLTLPDERRAASLEALWSRWSSDAARRTIDIPKEKFLAPFRNRCTSLVDFLEERWFPGLTAWAVLGAVEPLLLPPSGRRAPSQEE